MQQQHQAHSQKPSSHDQYHPQKISPRRSARVYLCPMVRSNQLPLLNTDHFLFDIPTHKIQKNSVCLPFLILPPPHNLSCRLQLLFSLPHPNFKHRPSPKNSYWDTSTPDSRPLSSYPAVSAAALPVRTNTPAPTMPPTPNSRRSQ